jgi:pilus assembly protein CpaB
MTKRFVGVLIFAFVVASAASLLLYRFLASSRPQVARAAQVTVRLALAARDLEVGALLKEEDIKVTDWPGSVPDGAFARTQDLVGRGVITRMVAREPVIESRLSPKGSGGGLASMIPPGMRAVAIRVNDVVGVAGFVTPGMRVDVLISGSPNSSANAALGTQSKTMLQNVEVLSAGQDYKKDSEGKPIMVQVVNLLVTPEQAEMLSLASTQTTIQLVLRNPMDRVVAKTNGTAVALLFKGGNLVAEHDASSAAQPRPRPVSEPQRKIEAPVRREPPFVMQIISGARKQEIAFPAAGGEIKAEAKNGEGK